MTVVRTDVKVPTGAAPRTSYIGAVTGVSTVQGALDSLQSQVTVAVNTPETITPTAVNFAMSPYSVLATDYILEVDTSGGVVVIAPQAVASRARKPLTVKDVTGNADTNPISISAAVDGLNPYPVEGKYAAVTIRPNAGQTAYEATPW